MISLKEAIYRTIIYFDIFDFAPTLLDMEKWLLKCTYTKPSLSHIHQILSTDERFQHQEGVYFLRGREQLVQIRKQKYSYTEAKWKHAKRFIRLLAMMPGIEAIWLVNSVAWGNARKQSDIDLLIITTPQRIWSARFFAAGMMKILRQRPHEQQPEKAICLSFYLTTEQLSIEPFKIIPDDIYLSFWTAQVYPVYDPKNLYTTYQRENHWLKNVFAQIAWTIPVPNRIIHLTPIERCIKKCLALCCVESLLKKIQLRIMPQQLIALSRQQQSGVILTDAVIKLHNDDKRIQYYQQWQQRLLLHKI